MKLLLTGAKGLLGSAITTRAAAAGIQVTACDHRWARLESAASLKERIVGHDWLLHCAANTNVEACEIDPGSCYSDNYLLTQTIVAAAAAADVPMAFVSSTGVYGAHEKRPYREYDDCRPTTHHHRSKLLAENCVSTVPYNLVIRTGWIFGGDPTNPKNFVANRLAEAAKSSVISSNCQQWGVPTYSADVTGRLFMLMREGFSGLFNVVNEGRASRYEYVQAILEIAGVEARVVPTDSSHFQRKALVSNNEMAENWRATVIGLQPLPDWRTSLASYIATIQGT